MAGRQNKENRQEHQAWLHGLAEQSRARQERFMNGIAAKLGRPRVLDRPEQPFRGAPEFWQDFNWSAEERLSRFIDNFTSVGGHPVRLPDMEAAADYIVEKAKELDARKVLRNDQEELASLHLEDRLDAQVRVWNSTVEDDWKSAAAAADFGVVLADYAAAYTGSVTVLSSKEKGRSVSLLPTALFVIIPIDRVKTRLGEVLREFDAMGRTELPAGVHFISGPSRSADIENDLTIGVHGPGIVFALLVG